MSEKRRGEMEGGGENEMRKRMGEDSKRTQIASDSR